MMQKALILALALQGLAHPGEDHTHELTARKEYLANNRVNLRHCQEKLAARGVMERSLRRRGLAAERLQTQMGSVARAVDSAVFATNASCVLSPEEILGPYCKSPCCGCCWNSTDAVGQSLLASMFARTSLRTKRAFP